MVRSTGSHDIPIYIVDAFTKDAFSGNPAAVCLLKSDTDLSDEAKQRIAAEMNQTVTAFACFPPSSTDSVSTTDAISLRWFTPTMEIALCGHATFATSAVFFHIHGETQQEVRYSTKSGILVATLKDDGSIALDVPQDPGRPLDDFLSTKLRPLLDACNEMFGAETIVDMVHATGTYNLMIRLQDHVDLENLAVDTNRLVAAHQSSRFRLNGIILTVKGSPKNNRIIDGEAPPTYDFVSRYFGPWIGIPEDHVCGSAHTVLAPYWKGVLGRDLKKARQVSKRGGEVTLDVRSNGRMELGTHCKIVMKGHLVV